MMRYSEYKMTMGSILSQIRHQLGPKVENSMVSYWCPKMECYVYIGQMKGEDEAAGGQEKEVALAAENEDPD